MSDDGDDNDRAGYCRPPKKHRFSSTNQPKRRSSKKGKLGIKSELLALWSKPITLKRNGVPFTTNPLPACLNMILQTGLSGKVRLLRELIELTAKHVGVEDLVEKAGVIAEIDIEVLAEFAARAVAEKAAQASEPEGNLPHTESDAQAPDVDE